MIYGACEVLFVLAFALVVVVTACLPFGFAFALRVGGCSFIPGTRHIPGR